MVFLTDLSEKEYVFTYGIFGVQYQELTDDKKDLIKTLHSLLSESAGRVDLLVDHTFGLPRPGPKSTVFVAYWLDSSTYKTWASTPAITNFWSSLSDDAGVWREVMTVPKSRFMHASNQAIKSGMGNLLSLVPSNDEGYWGVYRHRLSLITDSHTDPNDTFTSPFTTTTKAESSEHPPKLLEIPRSFPDSTIPGHVRPKIPKNLVFVREGQRQPNLPKEELDEWLTSIQPHAESWINHLDTERQKNGVLSFSTHLGHEVSAFDAINLEPVPETNQLCYFLDLAHFEQAGRRHKGHVTLRKNTMSLYGPGGKLEGGKAVLFVELVVLKEGDLEAEYVGCWEGTGLMFLDGVVG